MLKMSLKKLNMQLFKTGIILILTTILLQACALFVKEKARYDYDKMDSTTERIHRKVESFLQDCIQKGEPVRVSRYTRIDSVVVDEENEHVDIYFNRLFAFIPFRDQDITRIHQAMQDAFGWWDNNYSFTIHATNTTIDQLIPNFYRSDISKYDQKRLAKPEKEIAPIVRCIDLPYSTDKGLNGRHIALWHSHGWYYEPSLRRWEWQRARLFQSVEDLGPMSFTIPYIVPMLEKAGAYVFLPRERDLQVNEVIVDNDACSDDSSLYSESSQNGDLIWQTGKEKGFAIGHPPYGLWVNPFKQGTYRQSKADGQTETEINWLPLIPEEGQYAVYVSYVSSDSNITDAHYTVYHTGGRTRFLVNQQIGGGTWIYLGHFSFRKGLNPQTGKVVLSNQSNEKGKIVSADAVRFGGGMGNIERDGKISGRPRFTEAARYYLQYAGMPDSLVYTLSLNDNDYTDDYKGRGEWVNFLKGAPFGPNKKREMKGLGIPIDLSLAFHTDAGISEGDTVIGTLSIFSSYDADSSLFFPDSMSRFANRDFADILQTQIVEDLRHLYDPVWNRRGLWDRGYSEAFRPNVPSALLELLSHQNFLDMRFHQDPQFKFDVSRSIYKAMLKFLATQRSLDYVVQPLPVTHLSAEFEGQDDIVLRWRPKIDPLEETAMPQKYIIYTRIEDQSFDNGQLVDTTHFIHKNVRPGVIYSYRVAALNAGGESFPSEILSVCRMTGRDSLILIINGFDRVAAPLAVETETFTGFVNNLDAGVPDCYDLSFVGDQFNYNPASKWTDDDSPGFGASHADLETLVIPGNTFDFSFIHGQAIRQAGFSFVSVSDEAVMENDISIQNYPLIDLILGEEKKTAPVKAMHEPRFKTIPAMLRLRLDEYLAANGNLFITGAYVGSDLFQQQPVDTMDVHFARERLKYFFRTDHAARTGQVFVCDSAFKETMPDFRFNTGYHPHIYAVESPDGIEPADSTAKTFLRYRENNISAAVAYKEKYGVIVCGFPFEAIMNEKSRKQVMRAVLQFLLSR